ncbi:MAG: response regulator [Parcubacteria group bacterium]|nr:response regulator [Parcubacteria group bacterium]
MKRILLVDESPQVTRLYERVLTEAGFEVATAHSGEAAKQLVEAGIFDMAIIDLLLPGAVNGLDFLVYVRSKEKTKNIPVLVLSGLGEHEEIKAKCEKLDATCFSKGTLSLADLTAKVKQRLAT